MGRIRVLDQNRIEENGKVYDLSIAPQYGDALVQEEVKSVLGQLSLKDVTENLDLAVELFFVAYNGVAGARGGTIQAEIAKLQSKLALLCNECVKTMATFQAETVNIIDLLIQTYRWLTNGKEKLAITKLAHCSESSTKMSQSAKNLAQQFIELQVSSTVVRSNTIEEEASELDKKKAAEKAEREMRAKQKEEQINQTELVDQIKEMQTLFDDAKEREQKESDKALILGIVSSITNAIGAGLSAFAATKNPVGTLAANEASAEQNEKLEKAQKDANKKKQESDEIQHKVEEAKDEQTAKQNTVDKLTAEIDDLNHKIAAIEQDPSGDEDKLKKEKETKTAKQGALKKANDELVTANNKVQTLEASAKKALEAYAASGTALKELSKSSGQMAAAASAEESIRQEKMQYLNKRLELEDQKRKSLILIAEYAENIKNLQAEEGAATISVNSLHAAVAALGKIVGTLTNAGLFWDQMSAYCERMTAQGFQRDLKDLMTLDPEERLEEYKQPFFMSGYLHYMCQWAAINGLSGEYLTHAMEAQAKAVDYLGQSPTIDQAMKQAPELAKKLEMIISQNLRESRQISVDLQQQKALIEQNEVHDATN
jgi:hypothetical protein